MPRRAHRTGRKKKPKRRCYLCNNQFKGCTVHRLRLDKVEEREKDIIRKFHLPSDKQKHFNQLVESKSSIRVCCRHLTEHPHRLQAKKLFSYLRNEPSLPTQLPVEPTNPCSPHKIDGRGATRATRARSAQLNEDIQKKRTEERKRKKRSEQQQKHQAIQRKKRAQARPLRLDRAVSTRTSSATATNAEALGENLGMHAITCSVDSLNLLQMSTMKLQENTYGELVSQLNVTKQEFNNNPDWQCMFRSFEMLLHRYHQQTLTNEFNFNNYKRKNAVKHFTGLDVETIEQHFIQPTERTFRSNSPHLYRDMVFYLFTYMHTGWSLTELANFISLSMVDKSISRTVLTDNLQKTCKHLGQHCQQQVCLLDVNSWEQNYNIGISDEGRRFSDNRQLVLLVDGTGLKLKKSKLPTINRALWCNYKKENCWRVFIVTTLNGHIVHASGIVPGRTTDNTQLTQSGFLEDLDERYKHVASAHPEKFWLGGDKGYVDTRPPLNWGLIITKSGEKELRNRTSQTVPEIEDGADPEQFVPAFDNTYVRHFDSTFAKQRAVVEISVGKLKNPWALFNRGTLIVKQCHHFINNMVQIAAYCANLELAKIDIQE